MLLAIPCRYKSWEELDDGIFVVGGRQLQMLGEQEVQALAHLPMPDQPLPTFYRLWSHGQIYFSTGYIINLTWRVVLNVSGRNQDSSIINLQQYYKHNNLQCYINIKQNTVSFQVQESYQTKFLCGTVAQWCGWGNSFLYGVNPQCSSFFALCTNIENL